MHACDTFVLSNTGKTTLDEIRSFVLCRSDLLQNDAPFRNFGHYKCDEVRSPW